MSNQIVVDSSVIIKWLSQTNEPYIDHADQLMKSTINGNIELLAPELSKYEIGNALLKGKKLTTDQACISLNTLYSLPITFISESDELAKTTFSIAHNLDITYYDAAFLALAQQFNATLVTENIKHQRKTKNISVKTLPEYFSK